MRAKDKIKEMISLAKKKHVLMDTHGESICITPRYGYKFENPDIPRTLSTKKWSTNTWSVIADEAINIMNTNRIIKNETSN